MEASIASLGFLNVTGIPDDQHFATFVRLVISAQYLDQCGFASTILAQQCMYFTSSHTHINILEGNNARERLADFLSSSMFSLKLTQTSKQLIPITNTNTVSSNRTNPG